MFPGADYVKQLEYIINYVVLFTCFTGTIVQKLTRKALLGDPHERGPGRDVEQRAGQVGRAYQQVGIRLRQRQQVGIRHRKRQQVGIRHKAETASRHKA